MRLSLHTERVPLACVAATFLVAALAWPATPEQVPTHFGLNGLADGWGSRAEGLLIFPGVAVLLYLVTLMPLALAGAEVPESHAGALGVLRVAVLLFVLAMFGVALGTFHGAVRNVAPYVYPALAMLLVVIGLVVSRLRRTAG